MPYTTDFCIIGEEVAILGLCKPALSCVQGVAVKTCVVGGDLFDGIFFHNIKNDAAGVVKVRYNKVVALNALKILWNFRRIVGGSHQVGFVLKNIGYNEASRFVDIALAVSDGVAQVIDKGVIGRIRRFYIYYKIILFFLILSFPFF